ncbi:MAG: bifunctional folylpolyglutamate synthase/dihydrofolate synthase [Alphaproteobacteria bacterium]|nr:MAG: bifunctional folylpolyglutamate synthase/dihydrofolate synthase [Alphaproteobacteria bacterium]
MTSIAARDTLSAGAEALIDSLSAIHPKGYDLSLDRIVRVLDRLGNPQRRIPPAIHVAGTNGKGSTIAFCRAMLEAAGKMVHVHTSPHLVRWHERFRIGRRGGGVLVDDANLERAIARVAEANGGEPVTIFEILTAAMFLLFAEHPADYCAVEVGLGGRFDATNVIDGPLLAVITSIALDHQLQLGDTVERIAFEKAGIIKPGRPVVIGPQSEAVADLLAGIAAERAAPAMIGGRDFTFFEQAGRLVYQDDRGLIDLPLPRLRGRHQLANAATAIAAIRHAGIDIADEAIETAMTTVSWPGRMERLKPGRLAALAPAGAEIWIDGGHNPAAAMVIATELAELEERSPMPVVLVAGMLTTKDPAGFFSTFAGLAERVIAVPIRDSESGHDPVTLARFAEEAGLAAATAASVAEALAAIAGSHGDGPVRVLITGSLYLLGEVLADNATVPE